MRTLKRILLASAVCGVIFGAGAALLPFFHFSSSAPKHVRCRTAADQIGKAIAAWRETHNEPLPATLEELARGTLSPKQLHCPFDSSWATSPSYVYVPPDKIATLPSGQRVLLYCKARHPDELRSADGGQSSGGVVVLTATLETITVPNREFALSIKDSPAPPPPNRP